MKKIIVCCDGTWNKPGNKDEGVVVKTNVLKMFEAILAGGELPQVKYYGEGVGTRYSLKDHFLGGSTGLGIDRNILDAYKFLIWNYDPGDQIYLFGFSRGAYTVRSLAGFIRNCGILQPGFLHLVQEAYQLYRDRSIVTHPDSDLMIGFKKKYSIDVGNTPIHFLGVWDTVGALGIPLRWFDLLNRKYQFHDVKLSSDIQYAYHALSIDEHRGVFSPALWEINPKIKDLPNPPVREQVWFPGAHSNVGGGYRDCGLSDITLQWMMEKAAKTGLCLCSKTDRSIRPDSCGVLRNSVTGMFVLMNRINREINTGVGTSIDPETGEKKTIPVDRNEHIHYSYFERHYKNNTYRPQNITTALRVKTPYDPLKEQWKDEWQPYLRSRDEDLCSEI